jgi:hypothetical protein
MPEVIEHAERPARQRAQPVGPARHRRMTDARDIEHDDLARGHRACERLEQLDAAADAVEHQQRRCAAPRTRLAPDAQQLAAHPQHLDLERMSAGLSGVGDGSLRPAGDSGEPVPGAGTAPMASLVIRPPQSTLRSSRRRILPTLDFGSASTKRTTLGTL